MQALDVLDPGQDDVAIAAHSAGQQVDDLPDQLLHLLAGGRHCVDMQLVFAGDTINLRNGLIPFQLAGNHFLTITDDIDRPYALERKCLHEGTQPTTIELE